MEIPSVAELIKTHGRPLPAHRCSLCDRLTLYRCGEFVACLLCDTTSDSRQEVGAEGMV